MVGPIVPDNASKEELLRIIQELANNVRELQREMLLIRNAIDLESFGE